MPNFRPIEFGQSPRKFEQLSGDENDDVADRKQFDDTSDIALSLTFAIS